MDAETNSLELENLRFETQCSTDGFESQKPPRHRPGERFLMGPIPLNWLTIAANQPGKALNVGLAIWFWAGVKKTKTIRLSVADLADFGVKYDAAYRGLRWLEQAGLIGVDRRPGRKPVVTLLSPPVVETAAPN